MADLPVPTFVFLIIILFAVGFTALWSLINFVNATLGGWRRLAAVYASERPFDGELFHFRSGRMGWVNYSGVLTIGVSKMELLLNPIVIFKIAHPRLIIPLDEIAAEETALFLGRYVAFRCEREPGVRVMISKKIADVIVAKTNGRWRYKS